MASKRIDYILSPLHPVPSRHALVDDFTYMFSDHAAVHASYLIPSTQPTPFIPTDKEGQGSTASLSVLLSSRDKLIKDILDGNIRKFEPAPAVPEDANVPHAKGLPPMWDDVIGKVSTQESRVKL
jgi:hypothetical protein